MAAATSSSGEVDVTGADSRPLMSEDIMSSHFSSSIAELSCDRVSIRGAGSTPVVDADIAPSIFSTLASTARILSFCTTSGAQHPAHLQGLFDSVSELPFRVPADADLEVEFLQAFLPSGLLPNDVQHTLQPDQNSVIRSDDLFTSDTA